MLRAGVFGAAISAVLLATPAAAGDSYNWSGLYLGAHGGYGWADTDYPGQNPYVAPPGACGNAFGPGQDCGPPRPNLEGGLVGGQIGYNLQFHQIVIGAEVDYSFTKMSETTRDGNYITQDHEISSLASVRGRLGLAFGRFLPYVTGGWAWSDMSVGQTCPIASDDAPGHCRPVSKGGYGPYSLSKSETEQGWVYGAGAEVLIAPNWTLRTEYLRYDFDSQNYELGSTPTGKVVPTKTLEHSIDTVRLGVNYKFGGRDEVVPLK